MLQSFRFCLKAFAFSGIRSLDLDLADLAFDLCFELVKARKAFLLRKEVIQPQVPLRLPCYDFIPVTTHTVGHNNCVLRVQVTPMM